MPRSFGRNNFDDFPFLADLDVDNLVKSKLSLLLSSVVEGNDHVLMTPFGRSVKPDVILKEFDELFNSKYSTSIMTKSLYDLEITNKAKYGPRSIMSPWSERRESVYSYFKGVDSIPDLRVKIHNSRHLNTLRPIGLAKAIKLLKNSTNSGLPFYTRKGDIKDMLLDDFDKYLRRNDPCVLFTRTQEGRKTRNVWGYPAALTALEMTYYSPLLDYQKRLTWRSALLGPDNVDHNITFLLKESLLKNRSLVSIDFSGYDASVKPKLQGYAFDYIKCLFQVDKHPELDYIRDRFSGIGLVTPEGILSGPHGVPSGSTFTNEVDSIVQYLVCIDSSFAFPENMQIQGDDGVYTVNRDKVDSIYSTFDKYGLIVNRDKSQVSESRCYYLQKLYDIDYLNGEYIGGIYPVYRALNRLVYQERWTDFEDFGIEGKDYYSIRAICILENCKHHPLFEEFVKFILKFDKYKLRYTQNGLNKYVSMLDQARGLSGLVTNQYGDDVGGIANFETVKLINSMR